MDHPFKDKLFAFIGTPERCTRREARDALYAVGGVEDERISTFTQYVVAFRHNGKTDKYKRAVKDDHSGDLTLLGEQQFFDTLEGKADVLEKRKQENRGFVIPPRDPVASALYEAETWQMILDQERLNNMAKHGVPMPDGSRIKADLRLLDMASRVIEYMRENPDRLGFVIAGTPYDRCDDCGKPAKVHFDDNNGNAVGKLCNDCYKWKRRLIGSNHAMLKRRSSKSLQDMKKCLGFTQSMGSSRDLQSCSWLHKNLEVVSVCQNSTTKDMVRTE